MFSRIRLNCSNSIRSILACLTSKRIEILSTVLLLDACTLGRGWKVMLTWHPWGVFVALTFALNATSYLTILPAASSRRNSWKCLTETMLIYCGSCRMRRCVRTAVVLSKDPWGVISFSVQLPAGNPFATCARSHGKTKKMALTIAAIIWIVIIHS
jgi:hypothetical protein